MHGIEPALQAWEYRRAQLPRLLSSHFLFRRPSWISEVRSDPFKNIKDIGEWEAARQ